VREIQARHRLSDDFGIFRLAIPDPELGRAISSLLVVNALNIVEQVLLQLEEEGQFRSPQKKLAALIKSSESAVPWVNRQRIDGAREVRNRIAHEHLRIDSDSANAILDAVESELIAWKVIEGPVRPQFVYESRPVE